MNSKIMIWYAIALNIRKKILKKIIWITAAQRFLKELYSKKRPDNVTVLKKILKDADVWLISARWWTELQRKMPYNRVRGSQVGCIMANVSTTKMSSKGQVVIPDIIRKRLNLKPGSQFVVVGDKDVVILKNISPPALNEFDDLIAEDRRKGKEVGLKKSDILDAGKGDGKGDVMLPV